MRNTVSSESHRGAETSRCERAHTDARECSYTCSPTHVNHPVDLSTAPSLPQMRSPAISWNDNAHFALPSAGLTLIGRLNLAGEARRSGVPPPPLQTILRFLYIAAVEPVDEFTIEMSPHILISNLADKAIV